MKKHKPHVYRARLLALAAHLYKVKKAKFDFGTWIGIMQHKGGQDVDTWSPEVARLTAASFNECKTVGCALGHGCTMPKFKRLGLYIKEGEVYLAGTKRARFGTRAAAVVFGLSIKEANYCFVPDSYLNDDLLVSPYYYATPKEVADHLRSFASWKWPNAAERAVLKKEKAMAAFFAANPRLPQ